jgi:hypothetical protein
VELLEIVSFPVFRETDESKLVKTESGLGYEVLAAG